ncbi:MAG: hypothetical protein HY510_08290 [Acidobacteria bacterium]|nr:hypothetical protein [Acidobacteriota bacterium]
MIAPVAASGLTAGGVAFVLLAWGGIAGLTAFCFHRLFKTQERRPPR